MEKNQPLFTIKSTYSEKEFVRFNRYIMLHRLHYLRNIIVCNLILLLIFSGVIIDDVNSGDIPISSVITFLLIVFVNWKLCVSPTNKSKKAYHQNKTMRDVSYSVDFYDDHYVILCNGIESSVSFDRIYEIIETDTDYYIMLSKISGVIVPKEKCPEGFADFIHGIDVTKIDR